MSDDLNPEEGKERLDEDATSRKQQGAERAGTTRLSHRHVDRLVDLLALGEIDLPADLSPERRDELACAVRRRRRSRFTRLVAKLIAADIVRGDAEKGIDRD